MQQDGRLPEVDRHLKMLSSRVRALRARRKMTRKQLASFSGISERYLAQLETGRANPSLALLWQLARALGVHFQDLVLERVEQSRAIDPLEAVV